MDDSGHRGGGMDVIIPKWMPIYADMMTLLMCFFVLLLTFAEMDVRRYKQIAGSLSEAFGVQRDVVAESIPMGTSVVAQEFSPGVTQPTPISEVYQSSDALPELTPESGKPAPAPETPEPADVSAQIRRNVDTLIRQTRADAAALASKLEKEIARGEIEIETRGRKIVVRIRENGSFASGSADLKSEYRTLMTQLRADLAAQQGVILVQGHTDDVPVAGARFSSNWDLSSARAVSVAEQLLAGGELDPRRVSVTGFADTRPLGPNDSAAGRARNRRVEIVVNQSVDKQMREELETLKAEDPEYYRSLRFDDHDDTPPGEEL